MKQLFLIIGFLGYQSYTHSAINCKNKSGSAVDWFILYKLPGLKELETDGTEFYYMDKDNPNFKKTYAHNIAKTNVNPLFKTLKPIYDESPLLQSYVMYNDQPPTGKNAPKAKAHSKGVLAFDKNTGFWMISSIPRFPAITSKGYMFQNEQKKNGQIVLCVTVDQKYQDKIENILDTINPYIYDQKQITVGNSKETRPRKVYLKTHQQKMLTVFAKPSKFENDIYTELISPGLTDKIYVQTWRPNLDSTKEVQNIDNIDFGDGMSYKTSSDHSKWAVAEQKPFTCIGDLNRNTSQFGRGGLSLCLKNTNVAKSFRKIVKQKHRKIVKKNPPMKTCQNSVGKKIILEKRPVN